MRDCVPRHGIPTDNLQYCHRTSFGDGKVCHRVKGIIRTRRCKGCLPLLQNIFIRNFVVVVVVVVVVCLCFLFYQQSCERFEPRSHFMSRLSMIVRANVVLNRTATIVDSD